VGSAIVAHAGWTLLAAIDAMPRFDRAAPHQHEDWARHVPQRLALN
jgi:hypothetical protein